MHNKMFIYPLNKYGFRASPGTMLGAESRVVSITGLTILLGLMELSLVIDNRNNNKMSVKYWKEGTQIYKTIPQRKLALPRPDKGVEQKDLGEGENQRRLATRLHVP